LAGPNHKYDEPKVEFAVKLRVLPAQTVLPKTLTVGVLLIVTDKLADAVHEFAAVTVKLYKPELPTPTVLIVGFWIRSKNPKGPVQL
jgi:hypothetical protein